MAGRFNSQFDHDELAKITHRGLKPLARTDQPRVTHQNVETLRTAAKNEQKTQVTVRRLFDRIFGGIAEAFKGLFAKPTKKITQCENYGHILKPGWKGEFPVCPDCGTIITSPEQVRRASLKDEKPDDPYNNGRKYVT